MSFLTRQPDARRCYLRYIFGLYSYSYLFRLPRHHLLSHLTLHHPLFKWMSKVCSFCNANETAGRHSYCFFCLLACLLLLLFCSGIVTCLKGQLFSASLKCCVFVIRQIWSVFRMLVKMFMYRVLYNFSIIGIDTVRMRNRMKRNSGGRRNKSEKTTKWTKRSHSWSPISSHNLPKSD